MIVLFKTYRVSSIVLLKQVGIPLFVSDFAPRIFNVLARFCDYTGIYHEIFSGLYLVETLTHLFSMPHYGFLMFLGGRERVHSKRMG